MQIVRVNLGPRSYDIALASGQVEAIGAFARERVPQSRLALIACDNNTTPHANRVRLSLEQSGFQTRIATVPAGEESKTLSQASQLFDVLYELAADRKTLVVAVGGGVIGDLAGFV